MNLKFYETVTDLHTQLHEVIGQAKQTSPMAAIVLVVDSPMQGLLLRRQLVDSMNTKAIGNIQVKTFEDLMSDLSLELGLSDCSLPADSVIDAACYSAMLDNQLMQKNRAESLSTAMAIAGVFKDLKFVSDTKLEKLSEENFLSQTQKAVIQSVIYARNVLERQSSNSFIGNAIQEIIQELGRTQKTSATDSNYLVLTKTVPVALEELLEMLPFVTRFEIDKTRASQTLTEAAKYFTVSDPQTEVQVAVSALISIIEEGVHPYDIAITYADKKQYARLLASALDTAGISWHGAAETVAQASRVFQGADLLLQMLEQKTSSRSGVERPLLMRLLESGNFAINGMALDVDLCRQFVRDKEIYGDALGWYPILTSLVKPGSSRDAAAVDELKVLIKFLQNTISSLAQATTWSEFGQVLFGALDEIYGQENLASLSELDVDILAKFQQICLTEFPELDSLTPEGKSGLIPSATSVRAFILRKIGDRNIRTGSLHTGIHVSGLEEVRTLRFKRVIFVGATDGLLPTTVSENSFLTDEMLGAIGELGKGNVPISERNQQTGLEFVSYLKDSQPVILRSRGAMLGKLDDIESRFLSLPKELETKVESFEGIFSKDQDLRASNPNLIKVLDRRNSDEELNEHEQRVLRALDAFRRPMFNDYFGNLEEYVSAHGVVWKPGQKSISATAIEQFIKCRYGFFVKNALGFYTGERKDTLDTWRSKDFGNLIHYAMEDFINNLKENNQLPTHDDSFSSKDVDSFFAVYLQEQLKSFYAKGHDVWRAGFEAHMKRVTKILRHFFETEKATLRDRLSLGVHSSEFSFGYEDAPKVEAHSLNGTKVQLNGRIDRVDLSADEKSAGVLDFKTGSTSDYERKIGRPLTRGVNKGNSVRELVQDLVYTVALKQIFPQLEEITVNYAFIAASGVTEYIEARWRDDPEDQLAEFLQQMIDAGESGLFPVGHNGDINEYSFCAACERLGTVAELVYADANQNSTLADEGGGSDD